MSTRRLRNLVPPVYALLVLAGFLISPIAGVVVVIVGGSLSGVLWSALSRGSATPPDTRPATGPDTGPDARVARDQRAADRAARRSERR